jgi:predicted transcriptional regulator of viral defense system
MSQSKTQQILDLIREKKIIKAQELRKLGFHQEYIRQLEKQHLIIRVARGVYTLANLDLTENQSLIEASVRVDHGVVCLLSALRFHDLTTQAPFEVWMAIASKTRSPSEELIPIRIVYMSGDSFAQGIEEHLIAAQLVKVYNIPKTIADCFKYRHKIGLDVANEALRESWNRKRVSLDSLWHYAKICRVQNVMRPYLESLVW